MSRKQPTLTTKLASALLKLGDVPYEHAKLMSDEQIISLYQFHHNIYHAEDGPDEFWNLEPMLIAAHKERTRKIDVPAIAKNKRVGRKHVKHELKIEELRGGGFMFTREITREEAMRLYPSTALRGIRSRGFDKTKTRGFNGKVRPRKPQRP